MSLHISQDSTQSNGHKHNISIALPGELSSRRVDYSRLLELGREVLIAIGEDPEREGLLDTPRRWASWWREFIEYNPGETETTFESVSTDQMVCVSGMRVWSLCEHHMLPFYCDVSIGYIAGNKVLGLSKFARIAHQFAHQLQIQERLGQQIADEVSRITQTEHVAVLLEGEHLCMSARGIRTPGIMTSSIMRGTFREDGTVRQEFFQIVKR